MKEEIREIKLSWDYRILAISMVLMFTGAVLPTMLLKHGIDLLVSVIAGAFVSIVGNLALIYVTKQKLIVTEIKYRLS